MDLFGMNAKQWRADNPSLKGYVRNFAPIEQLVVLSNMESTNALLIYQELTQSDHLVQLNQLAITQMKSLMQHRKIIGRLSK